MAELELRDEILEPLRRTLRWMLSLRDAQGRIVCPEHGVEHTGKSAGAIVIASELAKLDARGDAEALLVDARQQARRVVGQLVQEENSLCQTFRPGRYDPFNCSNHIIDGGACSDALAELVLAWGERLPAEERAAAERASVLHARTYLRYAVLDKGIPAQRAWGVTGLAGAYALSHDAELARAAIEAVGVLEGVQHADGSYPYHPLEWGAEHAGSSDVSAFYQSRVTAFLMFALERMGRDPADELFRVPLTRGLEFLLALQGPDGIKTGLVEAKPWYWGAPYEVASHPFDVYALARGWAIFGDERYACAALAAFRAWVAHLGADGRPASHRMEASDGGRWGRSYQCPLFWAGHAMWLARAAPDLERAARAFGFAPERPADPNATSIDLAVTWFAAAQLARLEDAHVVAWVRGARPGVNLHHGSPHGSGLLRVYDKRTGQELVARRPLAAVQDAEWSGRRGAPSLARGWRSGSAAVRFSTWLARVHARAGRRIDALLAPWRTLRDGVLAFSAPSVSSAFYLASEVEPPTGDGVRLTSGLAWRDGTPVAGARIERRYRIDGEGLEVWERVVADGGVRGLDYAVPAAAHDVERHAGRVRYRLG